MFRVQVFGFQVLRPPYIHKGKDYYNLGLCQLGPTVFEIPKWGVGIGFRGI